MDLWSYGSQLLNVACSGLVLCSLFSELIHFQLYACLASQAQNIILFTKYINPFVHASVLKTIYLKVHMGFRL